MCLWLPLTWAHTTVALFLHLLNNLYAFLRNSAPLNTGPGLFLPAWYRTHRGVHVS